MCKIKLEHLALALLTCMTVPAVAAETKSPAPTKQPAKTSSSISVGGKNISMPDADANKLQKLRKEGVMVYYPTFMPSRFTLNSVSISDGEDNKAHPDYTIEFRDKRNLSISIESAYDGIGDGPDGYKTLKGNSKEFGPFRIDVFKPNSEGNATKDTYYLGSWMLDKQRVASEKRHDKVVGGRFHHFLGSGISDKEALSIVESLTLIK